MKAFGEAMIVVGALSLFVAYTILWLWTFGTLEGSTHPWGAVAMVHLLIGVVGLSLGWMVLEEVKEGS